jgi:hypothetical protein
MKGDLTMLLHLPGLRDEDYAAIVGYALQVGARERGSFALKPTPHHALAFERTWRQEFEPAWQGQQQLVYDPPSSAEISLPSLCTAAFLRTAQALGDLVSLAVCSAWGGSLVEWAAVRSICQQQKIDLSFAIAICHIRHAYRAAFGEGSAEEETVHLARRLGLPYHYEQGQWVYMGSVTPYTTFEETITAFRTHACSSLRWERCTCLFCYRCPDCANERLVEGRDLPAAQAHGGKCRVCSSYSLYQSWQQGWRAEAGQSILPEPPLSQESLLLR